MKIESGLLILGGVIIFVVSLLIGKSDLLFSAADQGAGIVLMVMGFAKFGDGK